MWRRSHDIDDARRSGWDADKWINPMTHNMADMADGELVTSGARVDPTAEMQSDGENGNMLTSGRRERGPPVWMQDYITGEDFSDSESNMALIMSSDPIYFEDAVKIKHWRLAMDSEINAIEKNNTWTLNELPEGEKNWSQMGLQNKVQRAWGY